MISAAQIREALALLGWTSPTLAKRALLAFDDVVKASDDVASRRLGGLQIGDIRRVTEAAGLERSSESGGLGARSRREVP